MTNVGEIDISQPDPVPVTRPMTPEEQAAHDAMLASTATAQQSATFETAEDAERKALVAERAAADPAFAALADLALRGG